MSALKPKPQGSYTDESMFIPGLLQTEDYAARPSVPANEALTLDLTPPRAPHGRKPPAARLA